jgi:hypothetical protein
MKTSAKLFVLIPFVFAAPSLMAETSGFAVTADLGVVHQSAEGDSGNAASAALGLSYQINPNWSASISYTDYGQADVYQFSDNFGDDIIYNATLSLDSTGLGVHAHYMTDRVTGLWSFGGRAGLVRWDTDINVKVEDMAGANGTVASDSGVALSAGFVAAYAITDQLDVTLSVDFMRYSMDFEEENGDIDNSRLAAGVKYHF